MQQERRLLVDGRCHSSHHQSLNEMNVAHDGKVIHEESKAFPQSWLLFDGYLDSTWLDGVKALYNGSRCLFAGNGDCAAVTGEACFTSESDV